MKKLQKLGKKLSKEEQKKILGGDEDLGCGCNFYYVSSGTCGVRCNGETIAYGMAQWEAQQIASQCGYYWCCASC
jgi:hypothetical protein